MISGSLFADVFCGSFVAFSPAFCREVFPAADGWMAGGRGAGGTGGVGWGAFSVAGWEALVLETDFTGTPRGLVMGAPGTAEGGGASGGAGRPGIAGLEGICGFAAAGGFVAEGDFAAGEVIAGAVGRGAVPRGTGYRASVGEGLFGLLSGSPANVGALAAGGICRFPRAGGAGGAIPPAPSAFGGRGGVGCTLRWTAFPLAPSLFCATLGGSS
jgi:hypothetical protein